MRLIENQKFVFKRTTVVPGPTGVEVLLQEVFTTRFRLMIDILEYAPKDDYKTDDESFSKYLLRLELKNKLLEAIDVEKEAMPIEEDLWANFNDAYKHWKWGGLTNENAEFHTYIRGIKKGEL